VNGYVRKRKHKKTNLKTKAPRQIKVFAKEKLGGRTISHTD
jgi:hypothetical protein